MPPKGIKGLWKFMHHKKKNVSQSEDVSKQLTISKFFAFNKKKSDVDGDVEIVIDESVPSKRKRPEEKVPSPIKKKQKFTDGNNSVHDLANNTSSSEKETSQTAHQPDSAVLMRVKDKLKAFEASEIVSEEASHGFDFTVLKRDKLASLPDINFQESSQLATCSSFLEEERHSNDENKNEQGPSNSTSELNKFSHNRGKGKLAKACVKREPVAKVKYTQLEQQFVAIKHKYPDAVLFVECGYKYRFFGKDAEIASAVLKIYSHQDHNFMTASIPTHRLFVHVRRIVSAGYKVGVVKQTETAALKAAGSNKNAPFTRELSALYTKSTLIGEESSTEGERVRSSDSRVQTSNTYLVCVSDNITGNKSKNKQIGLLAVQPSTGDIIYDSFEDTDSCTELETRLAHIQPVEILLSENASSSTCKLVRNLSTVSFNGEDKLRVERLNDADYHYNNAVKTVSQFYQDKKSSGGADCTALQEILNLSKPVLCCLSAAITYLSEFKLETILTDFSNFRQFSLKSSFMQLNKDCLKNLEVFQNSTDGRETGSLLWALNHTFTRAGSRLLRSWLSQPLLCYKDIMARQSAVTDILSDRLKDTPKLKGLLGKLPDLEKILVAVCHKKCSCSQVYVMLRHLETLHDEFKVQQRFVEEEDSVTSTLLRYIVKQIPELLENIRDFKSALFEKAAMENNKTKLFANENHYPAVVECKTEIENVGKALLDHRREVRLAVRQPSLEYTTILGTEYLIEVKNKNISIVPDNWVKISSTKVVSRFHSPFIVEKYSRLQQLREQLVFECDTAWQQYLQELSEHYQRLKKAVLLISTLDCLLCLATVAQMHGYTRPEICEDSMCIELEGGRHPVIQELIGQNKQYVPNDTTLNASGQRIMIITGPNMGGKSCYIKQVALLTILAQIGSYVPADSAKFGIFDAVYTRMGAEDQIYKGQSTFMVELSEVSNIMVKASSRSLVILDELGRGTSTHDGVAIACSTLDFFINQPRCLTLFVTHYPLLAEFENTYPDDVGNFHMSFLLHDVLEEGSHEDKITFLYQLVRGVAAKSYGLNVASLANIPSSIVEVAAEKSRELETAVQNKRKMIAFLQKIYSCGTDNLVQVLRDSSVEMP